MIFSFTNPAQVYPIIDGTLTQITRISSKREVEPGDSIQLYYRNWSESSCYTCLNAKMVTNRKCPIFDPKTYSKDVRCPSYINFLGHARVIETRKYESYRGIEDPETWAINQGFSTVAEAREHYSKLMGNEWESYPLTVITWELKKIKR